MRRSIARSVVFALVVGGCADADAPTTYGSIVLELRARDGDAEATFGGTATIVTSVGYGPCLDAFYREHADERFDRDDGESVVAQWSDRLCDDDESGREEPLACEVVAIEQSSVGPSGLVVTFAVLGSVEGREIAVGPLPDSASAACTGGALAGLHVGADAVVGLDAAGTEIWTAGSDDESVAVVGQAANVVVHAARLPPA